MNASSLPAAQCLAFTRRSRVARACLSLLVLVLPGLLRGAPVTETLVEFVSGPINPQASLTRGPDGNFYGTTQQGGASNYGTVFRMASAGALTTLAEFSGSNGASRGIAPSAALALGPDGNFYGTTRTGGLFGGGTVFRMTPAGALATLVDFTGNGAINRGSGPSAGLLLGPDGNFYGTTYAGGANSNGTVFRMTSAGVLTTLVDFAFAGGTTNRGEHPEAALVLGADGNFYGTTYGGGAGAYGTVFRMTLAGTLTTLVEFTGTGGATRGMYPRGALALGPDGNFYGTTFLGGANSNGTVFRMTPAGGLTTLVDFTFNGATNRGSNPQAGLTLGADGNFYGSTYQGGASNYGTIFRLTPAGAMTTLVDFAATGGANPPTALTLGPDGNLYGVTSSTAFRLTSTGVLTTLVTFTSDGTATNGVRGLNPDAGLILGADGSFYGTTTYGGAGGSGTIFRITPAGSLSTLVEFTGVGGMNRGSRPISRLVQGADGNFYGTTQQGGVNNAGTVFRLTPAGTLTTLVDFTYSGTSNRGAGPRAGLISGPGGDFYGTTAEGGANGYGTVFRLTPAGALTTLVEFTFDGASNRGANPYAPLALGTDGNLYGTTFHGGTGNGTVFRLTSAGVLATLVEFTYNGVLNCGAAPAAGLVLGPAGNFYGTTYGGGAYDSGTAFSMTPAGTLTTLVDFANDGKGNRGALPSGALTPGPDGNFYGATIVGGASSYGTIFRLTPTGELATLVDFTGKSGASRGNGPLDSPTLGPDGNFYGTTDQGGASNNGTIYRLRFGPSPSTSPASALLPASAILNGTINPNGAASTAFFEYGTAPNALTGSTAVQNIPAGSGPVPVSASVSGLAEGTIYYFRLRAENAEQFQPQRGATLAFVAGGSSSNLVDITTETGGKRLRWRGIAGRTYQIQSADTLAGPWQTFPGSVTASAGGIIEYLDATPSLPPERFYRTALAP